MNIEITRKQFLGILVIITITLVAGVAVGNRGVISFQAPLSNPGHNPIQIGPGTFGGDASDTYIFPGTVAAAALDVSGTIDAPGFTESGNTTLSNDISGNAATANTASDLSCTDCIGATEVDETEIQIKVSGDCAGRVVTGINADGSVSCEDDDSGGTDTDWTVSGNDIYSGVSGNVGIGDPTPEAKLTVNGSIEIADTAAACNAANAGAIKFTGTDFEGCVGGEWKSLTVTTEEFVMDLINGQHSSDQCTSLSGEVVDGGSGNKMCRFNAPSCPAGWAQYINWSTTSQDSGSYKDEIEAQACQGLIMEGACGLATRTCTTTSHTWSNTVRESRMCNGVQLNMFTWMVLTGCTNPLVCTGATNTTVYAIITQIGCY